MNKLSDHINMLWREYQRTNDLLPYLKATGSILLYALDKEDITYREYQEYLEEILGTIKDQVCK